MADPKYSLMPRRRMHRARAHQGSVAAASVVYGIFVLRGPQPGPSDVTGAPEKTERIVRRPQRASRGVWYSPLVLPPVPSIAANAPKRRKPRIRRASVQWS